jgi:hypothetical protein
LILLFLSVVFLAVIPEANLQLQFHLDTPSSLSEVWSAVAPNAVEGPEEFNSPSMFESFGPAPAPFLAVIPKANLQSSLSFAF